MFDSKEEYQTLQGEDEALLNNERQAIVIQPRRRPWFLWSIGNLVFTILNVAVFVYQIRNHILPSAPAGYRTLSGVIKKPEEYTYIGTDRPQELLMPQPLSEIEHTFNDTEKFMEIFAPDAYKHWETLLPLGRGYIKLGQHPELFGVTMYHQLHCLIRIRAVVAGENEDTFHIKHCFNYLREGIMCNADTTLEPGRLVHHIGDDGVDHSRVASGYDSQHTCKDHTQLWDFMVDEWHRSFPESDPMAHAIKNGDA